MREKKRTKTMWYWWFGVAAAVTGGVLVWRHRHAGDGDRDAAELGRVVLDAYGEDWATRLGTSPTAVRSAALGGGDVALRQALDDLVGPVEVDFDGSDQTQTSVPATVMVAYGGGRTRSRAELVLPWDRVPAAVRAELIRGRTRVSQTWRTARPA